jgi:hypothetical protein
MFLHGSTFLLMDNTKYFLQLENFPRFYGEDGTIPPFEPVTEKELKIIIGGKHRRQYEIFNEFLAMDISPGNVIYFRHT